MAWKCFISTFYHLSLSGLLRITTMSGSCQTWESDQNKLFAAFINLWSFNKVSFPASVSNITKHGRFRFSSSLFLKIQEICMHMIACWIILKVLQESRTQLISWDVMWEKDTISFLFLFLWFLVWIEHPFVLKQRWNLINSLQVKTKEIFSEMF